MVLVGRGVFRMGGKESGAVVKEGTVSSQNYSVGEAVWAVISGDRRRRVCL